LSRVRLLRKRTKAIVVDISRSPLPSSRALKVSSGGITRLLPLARRLGM
jgi:hypothetical protein